MFIKTKILDPSFRRAFLTEIDLIVEKQQTNNEEISYMDAVLNLCEKHDVEPDAIGRFLPKQYKDRIEIEAMNLNLMKRKRNPNKLPID